MLSALYGLGNSIIQPKICMYKDLGQKFDNKGNPIFLNLKRFNYKDKSGFQWAFGCLYNMKDNIISIIKMMPSNQVKEEIEKGVIPILEFMKRLNAIK